MKTNKVVKQDREIETLLFDYSDFNSEEVKEVKVVLQEPSFEEVCEAYKYLHDENGKLDAVTAGKLIFDLCALEFDDILLKKHTLMMSICGRICGLYVLPLDVEIKKKD